MCECVIVSRHAAAVAFIRDELRRLGVSDEVQVPVLETATVQDVAGKVIVGNVPLSLAASARAVLAVEFEGDPPRGAEYSLEQMRAAGAHLSAYCVRPASKYDALALPVPRSRRVAYRPEASQ